MSNSSFTEATLDTDALHTLMHHPASVAFMEKIPIAYARRYGLLGLAANGEPMKIAVSSPDRWEEIQIVSRLLAQPVDPLVVPDDLLQKAINKAYESFGGQTQTLIDDIDHRVVLDDLKQLKQDDLLDSDGRAPIIRLVNMILFEAVKLEASDIHVQPTEMAVTVRFRIDGLLHDAFEIPQSAQEEVISRIKVTGGMNIAEKRLPQDGRASIRVGDRLIDLRIATLPTSFGERAVIRLLDKSVRLYTLAELGMQSRTAKEFRKLIHREHGIVLVTGPTGSGKTTTLYAALQDLKTKERNVLTLEDPIEYALEGISQTQVSEKKGLTFASGLRSVLRQDPDVIMVGEIRDRETATMAIQAALTGHLVFSTLHTNDAPSAVARLLDLGVEPYLVASSLAGVLAQRLVRKRCTSCYGTPSTNQAAQKDCSVCRGNGFKGRIGIFELLPIEDPVRSSIIQRATSMEIGRAAGSGYQTLQDDGMAKVEIHLTTLDEVLRVIQATE